MDKKNNIKKAYDELDEMFGKGEELTCFADKKKRTITPVSLKNFSEFMSNLGLINAESMWLNFINDESSKCVTNTLEMSFPNESVDQLLEVINASNFTIIINSIMKANGISLGGGDGEGAEKKG